MSSRKILVTGMTSQQVAQDSHRKAVNYTGLLVEALKSDSKNEVRWLEPSCRWGDRELQGYKHVFVGIAPLLSMGANRAYGALSVIERMWGTGRLTLVYDQHDPALFTRALNAALKNWDSFTKPFFSYRREYDVARERSINTRLMMQAMRLHSKPWPKVLVPGLPWESKFLEYTAKALPEGARQSVVAVNLDSLVLSRWEDSRPRKTVEPLWAWSTSKSVLSSRNGAKWLGSLGLSAPVQALPQNHRIPTDEATMTQLRESRGYLSAPGLWTPQIAQALGQHAPVFADWEATSAALGPSWGWLPGTTENFDRKALSDLGAAQLEAYKGALKTPSALPSHILRVVGASDRSGRYTSSEKRTA